MHNKNGKHILPFSFSRTPCRRRPKLWLTLASAYNRIDFRYDLYPSIQNKIYNGASIVPLEAWLCRLPFLQTHVKTVLLRPNLANVRYNNIPGIVQQLKSIFKENRNRRNNGISFDSESYRSSQISHWHRATSRL